MSLPGICTTTELCGVTGLTPARLGQLEKEGIIFKDSGNNGDSNRNRWLVSKSIRGLLAFYKAGRGGTGKATAEGDLDPNQEKAKLDVLRQAKLSDDIELSRGNLIRAEEAEEKLAEIFKILTTGLGTLPDVLERDVGLTGDQVERAQASVDSWRDGMAGTLKKWIGADV